LFRPTKDIPAIALSLGINGGIDGVEQCSNVGILFPFNCSLGFRQRVKVTEFTLWAKSEAVSCWASPMG